LSEVEIAQRSIRGSFALFAGNFISAVFSFVSVLFIARLLGTSDYGVYTLAILVPTILLNFLGLGVSTGITRYAAYNLAQGKRDVAWRMTLNGAAFVMIFGVVLSVACFLASPFIASSVLHRPGITPLLRFTSTYVIAQAVFQSGVAALLGWSYMGKIAWAYIVQSILRIAMVIPLLYLGYGTYGAVGASIVSVGLGGGLAYWLLWKGARGRGVSMSTFFDDVRTLFRYGREQFVGSLASNITTQYVTLILALIATNSYVGLYQSATNFTVAISLTSGAVTQALFPAFAHLQGGKSDVNRAFRLATKYMGFAITPIVFLLMGASLQIIRLPLGASYASASEYLVLLSFSNITFLVGLGVLPSFFNGLGHTRYFMVYSLLGAGVVFLLAPVLAITAGLGVDGLIISILISNVVAAVVGLYLAWRFFHATVDYRSCFSILVACVLAYGAVLLVSTSHFRDIILLPSEVVVFVLVYLTAAPLVRAVGSEDLDILERALGGMGRFRPVFHPILRYERFILRSLRMGR
jgi:O-antigen/teichoic acid export membrane protein